MKKTRAISWPLLGALLCADACGEKDGAPARSPLMPAKEATATLDAGGALDPGASSAMDGSAVSATQLDAGAPAPTPQWATRPERSDSPFSYVMDGYCVQAKVSLVENATLVHYGEHGMGKVALATDTGVTDWEQLSRGVSKGTYFGNIVGTYPDNLWYGVDVGTRAFTAPKYLHYTSTGWSFAFGADGDANMSRMMRAIAPLAKGALAAAATCNANMLELSGCRDIGVIPEGTDGAAPALGTAGFEIMRLLAFAAGDVWAFGAACTSGNNRTCTRIVRRWKPGGKIAMDTLGTGEWSGPLSVIGSTAADVTISTDAGLLRFDGTSWKPFAWPGKLLAQPMGAQLFAAPDGTLYLLQSHKVERRRPDGVVQALPSNVDITELAGVEAGAPWAVLASGKVARLDEAALAWVETPVPRSPFAWTESKTNAPVVEHVWVRSPQDVWISATYTEWPSHWGEQQFEKRRAILRTLPVSETLRCTGGEYGASGTLGSSPPLATPTCKTPLVLMASVPHNQKTDFPTSRKIIAKHQAELAGIMYLDFTVSDRRYLGAKVPSFEMGKKLLAVIRAETPLARPDLVCAQPEGTIVDLAPAR